jgi:hypothetical protein
VGIGDSTATAIQNQNLVGDDVAAEINQAMGEQMNGSVTPPTVVQPTQHQTPPMPSDPAPAAPEPPTPPSPPEPDTPEPPAADEPTTDDTTEATLPEPELYDASPANDITTDAGSGNFSELQDIKVQALQQLGPLVKHIDQDPEEKFNTLLMMIRASDDETLIKPAYEAAQAIDDDKKRAQALLDVVNEVNYLTRPQEPTAE